MTHTAYRFLLRCASKTTVKQDCQLPCMSVWPHWADFSWNSHQNMSKKFCDLKYNIKYKTYIYIKVKWSRYRPGLTQRVGRGIALLFHDRATRRGWVVSSTPRPHFTPRKEPVSILQVAGWALGPVWTGGKSRPHRDSIPDRPTRSSVAVPTELPGTHTHTHTHTHIYIYIKYSLIQLCILWDYIRL